MSEFSNLNTLTVSRAVYKTFLTKALKAGWGDWEHGKNGEQSRSLEPDTSLDEENQDINVSICLQVDGCEWSRAGRLRHVHFSCCIPTESFFKWLFLTCS